MAIASALGTRNADNSLSIVTPSRTGPYGEAFVLALGGAKSASYAEEGSYFTTYNVTDGTGIIGHAAPVQTDLSLKPLIHIFNSSPSKFITIDFIRLRVSVVAGGGPGTTTDFHTWIDSNGATSKTSGGTVGTVVNVNPGITNAFAGTISMGAVVAVAGANEVRLDHQRVRSVLSVVEDQYVFQFGGAQQGYAATTALTGTTINATITPMVPAVVAPLGNFKLSFWSASMTSANSFEYSVGLWQR